jgi:hypothetical protein
VRQLRAEHEAKMPNPDPQKNYGLEEEMMLPILAWDVFHLAEPSGASLSCAGWTFNPSKGVDVAGVSNDINSVFFSSVENPRLCAPGVLSKCLVAVSVTVPASSSPGDDSDGGKREQPAPSAWSAESRGK